MMNNELIQELRKNLVSIDTICELSEVDARSLIDGIAARYIADRSRIWWWEGLAEKPLVIDYGEDLGWDYIVKLVQPPEHQVYLVATDDDPEPWFVFKGSVSAVANLLGNMWRFEYIIVDVDLSWVIFDTHHNSLVVVGALVDQVLDLRLTMN